MAEDGEQRLMRMSHTECKVGGIAGMYCLECCATENEREDQMEGVQDSGKTSTDVGPYGAAL